MRPKRMRVLLSGGAVLALAAVSAPAAAASAAMPAGPVIALVTENNVVLAKQGMTAQWAVEYGNPGNDEYGTAEYAWAVDDYGGPATAPVTGISYDISVSSDSINGPVFSIDSDYLVLARQGLTGGWNAEFNAASAPPDTDLFTTEVATAPVDGPYVGILLYSAALEVQRGLTGSWDMEYGTPTNHEYCYVKGFSLAAPTS